MTDKCFPFTVTIVDHDQDNARLTFRSAAEVEAHFGLSEPLREEGVAEILRIAMEGDVHACICPYAEDIHGERCLMTSHSSSELDEEAYQAAMDI